MKNQERMILVIDFGGSSTKIIGGRSSRRKKAVVMLPSVIEIERQSLLLKTETMGLIKGEPESRAWIGFEGRSFAVGNLAQEFLGNPRLSLRKSDIAVHKVLAACWVLAKALNFGKNFDLALACLLPPGEYTDQERFQGRLETVLEKFQTPDGDYQVKLTEFNCKPEGVGVFMNHWRLRGDEIKSKLSANVMLGYRNASVVLFNKGNWGDWQTTDLGFVKLLKSVQKLTAGFSLEALATAVSSYGDGTNCRPLKDLLQNLDSETQTAELERLKTAIAISRKDYSTALTNWLEEMIPGKVEEIVLSGGTADYLASDLRSWVQKLSPLSLYWHGGVKLPSEVEKLGLGSRLADVWSIWEFFLGYIGKKEQESRKLAV